MDAATKSGMRGMRSGLGDVSETDPEYSRPETASEENMAEIIGQHVHGPDENANFHLNLSTLAEHIGKKKSGAHSG